MNPMIFAMRRPITTAMTVVASCSAGGLALARMRVDVRPDLNAPRIDVFLDYVGMSPDQIEGFITYGYALCNGKKSVFLPIVKKHTGSTFQKNKAE
jgi:Cu/Ag efflux pump CusA